MPRKWTAQEDAILRARVKDFAGRAIDWSGVSNSLNERSNKDCRKRWQKIDVRWNSGSWTAAEDERLRTGVVEHGQRWVVVSLLVNTRNPDQCAKRWRNHLSPSLSHEAWDEESDESLIRAIERYGRDWTTIAKRYFPSRSTQGLINRYALLRRRQRPNVAAPSPPTTSPPLEDSNVAGLNPWPDETLTDSSWGTGLTPDSLLSCGMLAGPLELSPQSSSAGDVPMTSWTDDLDVLDGALFGLPDSSGAIVQQSQSLVQTPAAVDSGNGGEAPSMVAAVHKTEQKIVLTVEDLDAQSRAAIVEMVLQYGGSVRMRQCVL